VRAQAQALSRFNEAVMSERRKFLDIILINETLYVIFLIWPVDVYDMLDINKK